MAALQNLQDEIGEKLCTLSREKLAELSVSFHLIREDETNLNVSLLRTELEELEDGGMAELLTINDKLNQLRGITINHSEPGTEREGNKSEDVNAVPRAMPEIE